VENSLLLSVQALLLGYLPGALMFRLPVCDPARRARLPADERVFWHVMISLAWSLGAALVLAALERYRFDRLLIANTILTALLTITAIVTRRRTARRPAPVGWTVALPLGLILLGMWRFFPPSEYVIGGKDPGVYINEGVQIAQRGTLTIHDPVVAAVPDFARDLFFPSHFTSTYYGTRFMGFFVRDPRTGAVTGQFPQLFPISVAIGYGLDGLTGARLTIGIWGILGLLAVYFLGARFVGRPAALAASTLLALNVAEVWFARYPNSELAAQALLFAALLAFARSHQDDDSFFVPVAAALTGLALFTRVEMILVVAAMVGAGLLVWVVSGRTSSPTSSSPPRALRPALLLWLLPWIAGAWLYYMGPLLPYFALPMIFVEHLPALATAAAAAGLVLLLALLPVLRSRLGARLRPIIPTAIAGIVVAMAVYAAFFRQPGGRLAAHDAYALRNFTNLYLLWPGLAAALVGIAVVVRREFWRDPAFVLTFSGFAILFLYKIRVVPEEFWAARRLLPIILPGALLFAAAAGLGPPSGRQRARRAAGLVLVGVLAWQYAADAAPVTRHVEYAGIIPALERLASRFGDRDLVLVESRDAGSDTHVLALPLAYIYARNVLVLNSARPDKLQLRLFLEDARTRYAHVYFVGGGGTDLLSRQIGARAVADERVKVPEFETASERRPSAVLRKDFDYSVYELSLDAGEQTPFVLDVGDRDDLNVLRFNAKERSDDRTVRWTGPQSVVAIPGMTGSERQVVLVMHDGGRPAQAPQAHVEVYLNGTRLGGADVRSGFQPYTFQIPPDTAARAATGEDTAQLTLVSTVWTPRQYLGGTDDRRLGVMVDRVEVR
jgi:hypothetical protein